MLPKITNKKIILALLLLIIVAAPFTNAVVLESGMPNTDLKPGTDIKGITITQYIKYIYLFVLGVIGIAVFASLVFWGVVWISSGIADKRGMALGKIKDAFTGLAIALGAYIILNTINPDLLTLNEPKPMGLGIGFTPSNAMWACGSLDTNNWQEDLSGDACKGKSQPNCTWPYTPKCYAEKPTSYLRPTLACGRFENWGINIDYNYYPIILPSNRWQTDQSGSACSSITTQPVCNGLPIVCYKPRI